jgi:hypothetical protein
MPPQYGLIPWEMELLPLPYLVCPSPRCFFGPHPRTTTLFSPAPWLGACPVLRDPSAMPLFLIGQSGHSPQQYISSLSLTCLACSIQSTTMEVCALSAPVIFPSLHYPARVSSRNQSPMTLFVRAPDQAGFPGTCRCRQARPATRHNDAPIAPSGK